MKVRRIVLEVEVPWEFDIDVVLECLRQGFDEIGYSVEGIPVPHQEQLIHEHESPNTQIGDVTEWPPRIK